MNMPPIPTKEVSVNAQFSEITLINNKILAQNNLIYYIRIFSNVIIKRQ